MVGPADPHWGGIPVLVRGAFQGPVGGTSEATPFWAASLALVRQYAAQRGVQVPGGDVGPLLQNRRDPAYGAFNDVTLGGNLYYPATPGWDYATGLGSPDVTALATAMVKALQGG